MAKGYILVRLFLVKNASPEASGNLKITDAETGEVVYQKDDAFNISGTSELIAVNTPEKSLSLEPNAEGIVPYGRYNIYISSNGFEDVIVKGVSVFDDNTSIQNIVLTKIDKTKGIGPGPDVIVIPESPLVTNPNRDRQEGPPSGGYVLGKVYIPEFIVVHLGSPSSNAENVTVGFVDYIKNVASSEIYPTWPTESLKANIYSQISFALNRVYTEWYRNKGYSFQITNSTAYDQFFVKGRNIFENISQIVDEIFNKYVVIVGTKAPYFTQYCNGTTSTCNGLSQWGTVPLAEKGKSALDIIRYYFGYDKELVRAEIIEGIPESYPGTPLRLNDVNENVRVIQKQLNRISQNFPAIPKINPVDGRFGKSTEEAVKKFQSIFNLSPDGIVGRATWYKISSIYVAVKRLAELNQEPEIDEGGSGSGAGTGTGNGKYPGYILRYGSTGDKVKEMQTYLAEISKYYNITRIRPDGIFGRATEEAVLDFQRLFGLTPDGLVGINTWNKIYDVYLGIVEGNPENPNPGFDGRYPGYILKYGSRGDKVLEMQTYLAEISKFYNIPKITPDGIFGSATKKAVLAFQRLFGLAQDGLVGKNTWDKIYEVYRRSITPKQGSTKESKKCEIQKLYPGLDINNEISLKLDYSSEYPGYILKYGSRGDDVKWLQTYLKAISMSYTEVPHLGVTGIFDRRTKTALQEFQKAFALSETKTVGVNDWKKILLVYNSLDIENDVNKSSILYPFPGVGLELGDDNGYVAILQQYINVIAKNKPNICQIYVSGKFDKETKEQVENLQREFLLDITGRVDEVTWNTIASEYETLFTGVSSKRNKRDKRRHK